MNINVILLCIFLIEVARVTCSENTTNRTKLSKINGDKAFYPKKVTSLKKKPLKATTILEQENGSKINLKTKTKPLTDIFKNLPADDFAFIKELDKQINQHGGKLKIKIENDNSTDAKNPKRTIDGELGYGYSQNGYHYTPPKYEFYPYSQHDIPPASPKKQQQYAYYLLPQQPQKAKQHLRTEVTIQPSYSYELKSPGYYDDQPQIDLPNIQYHHHQQENHAQQQQQPPYQGHQTNKYEEPVIVLRIPGPTKYATHLQALLQQYLEIRAAQYLQILEAHELQQQEQQEEHNHQLANQAQEQGAYYEQQQHQQDDTQQQQYPEQPHREEQHQQEHQNEEPQVNTGGDKYGQQVPKHYPTEQKFEQSPVVPENPPSEYPAVQHNYHQAHVPQQNEPQLQPQYVYYDQSRQVYQEPTNYNKDHGLQVQYVYTTSKEHTTANQANSYIPPDSNADVYLLHMTAMPHMQYHEQPISQPIYVPDNDNLPISENSPRPTHTKVIFKTKNENPVHNEQYERHTPISRPTYYFGEHQHIQQQQHQHIDEPQIDLTQNINSESHTQEVVITQRPHSYGQKLRTVVRGRRRGNHGPTVSTTTRPIMDTDKHYRNIQNYVREKYGAQTGSTLELPSKSMVKV